MDPLSRLALVYLMVVTFVFLMIQNRKRQGGSMVVFDLLAMTSVMFGIAELSRVLLGDWFFYSMPTFTSLLYWVAITFTSFLVTIITKGILEILPAGVSEVQMIIKSEPIKLEDHRVDNMYAIVGIGIRDEELGVFRVTYEGNEMPNFDEVGFWGSFNWDPVTCWRAMQFLELLSTEEFADMHSSYSAARRKPSNDDVDAAKKIKKWIGPENYQDVMEAKIPERVIRLYFRFHREKRVLDYDSVTEEVRAGTIVWRDDFSKIGIKNPNPSRKKSS